MLNSIIRTPALLLTIPFLTILSSNIANADIYKWRDNRGVIQYSDRPPVSDFVKATRSEIVNALQTKDLCTTGPIQKLTSSAIASTKDFSAFFGGYIKSPVPKKIGTPLSAANNAWAKSIGITRGITNQYSPLNPTSTFTTGGTKVTVVSSPAPAVTSTPKPATSIPAASAVPTAPAVAAPVVTAPAGAATVPAKTTTNTTPAPTQVATVNNTPVSASNPSASPNLVQVALMPAVDISKNMIPAFGYADLRIGPSNALYLPSHGEFRISCAPSHMSNDDPIVYQISPKEGAAHHHTFFGNTSTNYASNLMTFATTGKSTCQGGIANRSAYWMPSMIDTSTNTPIVPDESIFYYKTTVDGTFVKTPPKGLRMIAGNSKANTEADAGQNFSCLPGSKSKRTAFPWQKGIPKGNNCEAGDTLVMAISFPQCWDGKNLDSPNHQDHMSYPSHKPVAPPNDFYCPASHPIAIPQLSVNARFYVTKANQTTNWRLASDNYANTSPGGYSMHADWVNGWDETIMAGIVKNCLNAKKDGQANLLCDGRSLNP